jgi:hypothetical protein
LFAWLAAGYVNLFTITEELMKKSYIVIAVFISSLAFCTKDNSPTDISAKSDYSDSIVMDLYSYNVYVFTHYKQYYGEVEITEKGRSLLRPLDSSILRSYDTSNLSVVIVPKYKPNRFEAWVEDTIPLITVDPTDPNILVKSNSFSSQYFFRLDTAAVNLDKCIKPVAITYKYGYGFVLPDPIWGCGKLKIYYK